MPWSHKLAGAPIRSIGGSEERVRYSGETLSAELGADFRLVETINEPHRTPAGGVQAFCYSRFIRRSA